jgi:hypothetical protein
VSRRFEVSDISRTQRIMQALLPEGVSVNTSAVRDGWELAVVVCGKHSCETYNFTRSLADKHLLFVAATWATGEFVRPVDADAAQEINRKALASKVVGNRNELATWCREAPRRDKVSYFSGVLSQFRFDAPRRLVKLQGLADKAKASRPRPQMELVEAAQLRETLDLLELVTKLHDAGRIELVQHRLADGSGATYYAVKR